MAKNKKSKKSDKKSVNQNVKKETPVTTFKIDLNYTNDYFISLDD